MTLDILQRADVSEGSEYSRRPERNPHFFHEGSCGVNMASDGLEEGVVEEGLANNGRFQAASLCCLRRRTTVVQSTPHCNPVA